MKYARKLHICFVQYFHYNSDWFSVQIYYVQTFLHCKQLANPVLQGL